mmetsp:Transcript_40097/g.85633  ORF Transcript_40097/g.85633 Transcript_40097/m.85633 type:complete len:196 (-) Transcript_40097:376-963(-)
MLVLGAALLLGAAAFAPTREADDEVPGPNKPLDPMLITGSWSSVGKGPASVLCSPIAEAYTSHGSIDMKVDAHGGIMASVGWEYNDKWMYRDFGGLVNLNTGQIELISSGAVPGFQTWSGTLSPLGDFVDFTKKGRTAKGVLVKFGQLHKVSNVPKRPLPTPISLGGAADDGALSSYGPDGIYKFDEILGVSDRQ